MTDVNDQNLKVIDEYRANDVTAEVGIETRRFRVTDGVSPDDAVDDPTDVATGRPTRFKLRLWRQRE